MSRSLGVLTQEQLKELLDYNPATGDLVWKVSRGCVKAGDVAGTVTSDGYIAINLGGRIYRAHRLVWLYHYGEWPKHEIDHIDREKLSNRIENLRDVPRAVNLANRSFTSATGFKGVYREKSRFMAQICHDGCKRRLGTFASAEEAHEAFKVAHIDLYGANSEYCKEAA